MVSNRSGLQRVLIEKARQKIWSPYSRLAGKLIREGAISGDERMMRLGIRMLVLRDGQPAMRMLISSAAKTSDEEQWLLDAAGLGE